MPEGQIVTRAARRRAEAELAHSTGVNAPTANAQSVDVVVPAPLPALTAQAAPNSAKLVAQGTARRRRTQAGSGRAPRGRQGRFGTPRRARRTPARSRAVLDDPDTIAGVEEKQQPVERDSVERDDQLDQGPQIFNNPIQAQGEDANDDQAQDEPMEDDPEDDQEEEEDPSEPDDPPRMERCTSPRCPVPSTIPHNLGLYLHDGQPNRRLARYQFGISNPPPEVWIMIDRLFTEDERRPEDREAFNAFVRYHAFQAVPFWDPAIHGELVTVN